MTERNLTKKADDAFSAIIGFIADPVVVMDSSGRIIASNPIVEKIIDVKMEDFINKNFFELKIFNEKQTILIKENLKKRLSGNSIEPYRVTLRGRNGQEILLEVNAKIVEYNGQVLDVVVFHDVTHTKKMRTALRTSEERFNGIARSIKDPLILVNEDAKVTYWNPAAEITFGYTNDEALGKVIHELVVPKTMCKEGKDRIQQSVKSFSNTGLGYFTVGNVEVTACRKDGSEFPAELSLSSMRSGGKWNAVAVVKDITRRKLSNQKLKEAEQRYHALFSQAPIGVMVIDPETASFAEFNDIAHLQLGYSRQEFEKITIFDIQAEETPEQVKAHLKELVKNGGGEFETKHRTKTGEICSVGVTNKAFKSQGKTYLHCIAHDVTEGKKVQNALMASEARYRQLVKVAEEGIWAIDNDYVSVFVNPRMAQMLGYQESEMLGKTLFDFLDADWVEKIRGILIGFTAENTKGQYEYAFPQKNGSRIDTLVTISIITDDQKKKTGYLAVISDISQRKKAERALKASEELSKAVVANAPIGIATSDKSRNFLTANEAFCKILGYSETELRKLTFKELTHPDELARSFKNITMLERGEIPSFVDQKRYIRKDGTTIIGRVIINAIRNSNGKPVLFVVELEDITKHKQLEDDLRSSEERFRAISTSAMDGIVLSDAEDHILYWNPAAEKTFGFSSEQALGKKLSELVIPPQAHSRHLEFLADLSKASVSKRQFGLTALRSDGTSFPIDLSVVSEKVNNQNCLLAIIKDITEWKAMEEALRQEKDLLESVTTSTNVVLSIVSRDYRIIWANRTAQEVTGCGKLENKYCYETFGGGSKEVCEGCGVKRVFENGEAIVRRDYHRKTQDRDVWTELISTPIKDKNGKVIAALEIAIDINERKRLQNKLAEYSQLLEGIVQKRTGELKKTQADLVKSERLAAIGELAGMIGHDLRNPLTGIKNSVYFMKKKGSQLPPGQAREMLETIDKCVDYSNRIINDLLDYSREIHLALESQSPKKLLDDSLIIMNIPENVKVKNKLSQTPIIKVDPDKTKRVFINLIKNAVDAMPDGGKITVEGKEVKGGLEISFADTGIGIGDEILPKLFSPLFTTKAQGMGFGLAICKRIIEAHRGTISVKTVKGQGTTFTITLPVDLKNEMEVKTYG